MKLKLIYKNLLAFLAFLLFIQDINATILTFTTESEKVKVYTSMNEIQDYGSKVAADKQKSKSGNHTYVYDIGNGWTPNLSVSTPPNHQQIILSILETVMEIRYGLVSVFCGAINLNHLRPLGRKCQLVINITLRLHLATQTNLQLLIALF